MSKLRGFASAAGLTALLSLTSCHIDLIDDDEAGKNQTWSDITGDKIQAKTMVSGHFAAELDNGIYVFELPPSATGETASTYLLVLRDKIVGQYEGYFGTTEIDTRFVPQRKADSSENGVNIWTILNGQFALSLANGFSSLNIPGEFLNGTDLNLTVIKDDSGFDYEGYFGIQANMPEHR